MRRLDGILARRPHVNTLRFSHTVTEEPLSESQPRTLDSMPAPRGLPGIGTTLSLLMAGGPRRLHEYVDRRHQQLGPIFKDRIGPVTAVFVSDPTEMRRVFAQEGKYPMHILPEAWMLYNQMNGSKRGLLFMDGEEWLATRRVMNGLLMKPDRSSAFGAPCRITAKALVRRWMKSRSTSLPGLEEQLYRWSLDTIIATLMGSQYEAHEARWYSEVERLSTVVHSIFEESGRMSIISANHARMLHLPVWNRFVRAVDVTLREAHSLVSQIMAVCAVGPRDGLLSQLLDAGIPKEGVVNIVVDLIIAAGDTTALSTQWALYLLAKNKSVQEEVADDILKHDDETLSPLLRGVVREALRLYPVAPFLTRIMPDTCVVGGYQLPPMQLVLLSIFSSSRDASNFDEPNRFWPGRWIRESDASDNKTARAVRNPYASLPFAMGARSCIGRKLAEMQMMTTLAEVLKQFRLDLLNKEDVEMILRLVSVPSRPIKIGIKVKD